ncbi:MAG TPA: hypothetical protein PKI19_02825 [Elusimicrobiales bacterium]|nr:hypothetical protein [Elusimicrobiales bacterium]
MPALAALFLFLFAGPLGAFDDRPELQPYALLEGKLAGESSAWLKSPSLKNVYWTLNDSGNAPVIFAFTRDGKLIKPEAAADAAYKGVVVSGAANRDWEALAADDKGNLIVGDIGNNRNRRKNLAVYIVPEPDPWQEQVSSAAQKVMFRYPDQENFPPAEMNFDAEALFWSGGRLHLLTKHRSDTRTRLYRFESLEPGSTQTLKLVSSFDVKAMATDAALSPDGKKLAVLTYDGAWLFEKPGKTDNYFSGAGRRFAFGAGQCEGLTFDGPDTLLVSNEGGELFEIKLSSFTRY